MISAVSMMLDFLGEDKSAARIEGAVAHLLSSGQITSADTRSGISTSDMGDMVVREIRNKA
jgi:isocitrate/isopropylmalate dehydrogenase